MTDQHITPEARKAAQLEVKELYIEQHPRGYYVQALRDADAHRHAEEDKKKREELVSLRSQLSGVLKAAADDDPDSTEPLDDWLRRVLNERYNLRERANGFKSERDQLRAENAQLKGQLYRAKSRVHTNEQDRNCPFCECHCSMCHLCELESDADALRADNDRLKGQLERAMDWAKVAENNLVRDRDATIAQLRAETAQLKGELAPLRELVGVDSRAVSALSDINHWTKMMDKADMVDALRSQLEEVTRERDECERQFQAKVQEVLDEVNKNDSLRSRVGELEAEVSAMWTKKLPIESGLYWWWNEDEDSLPIPINIEYSGTDGTYFATADQYGWTRFQPVTEMGGYWIRLHEPITPPTPNQPKL